MELIDKLRKDLGVNERQAQGGVGAVLYVIKDHLSSEDFEEILHMMPESEGWMKLSPEGEPGFFGVLDNVFKSVAGGSLEVGARLGGHFHSLGISTKLVGPFLKHVFAYLEENLDGKAQREVSKLSKVVKA